MRKVLNAKAYLYSWYFLLYLQLHKNIFTKKELYRANNKYTTITNLKLTYLKTEHLVTREYYDHYTTNTTML